MAGSGGETFVNRNPAPNVKASARNRRTTDPDLEFLFLTPRPSFSKKSSSSDCYLRGLSNVSEIQPVQGVALAAVWGCPPMLYSPAGRTGRSGLLRLSTCPAFRRVTSRDTHTARRLAFAPSPTAGGALSPSKPSLTSQFKRRTGLLTGIVQAIAVMPAQPGQRPAERTAAGGRKPIETTSRRSNHPAKSTPATLRSYARSSRGDRGSWIYFQDHSHED